MARTTIEACLRDYYIGIWWNRMELAWDGMGVGAFLLDRSDCEFIQ